MHSPRLSANLATAPMWHEGYLRGVADGRRTVEAELDSERQAIAALANSMLLAVDQVVLRLNPGDAARIDPDRFEIKVVADRSIPIGAVHVSDLGL